MCTIVGTYVDKYFLFTHIPKHIDINKTFLCFGAEASRSIILLPLSLSPFFLLLPPPRARGWQGAEKDQ